jgi:hypothetical protein
MSGTFHLKVRLHAVGGQFLVAVLHELTLHLSDRTHQLRVEDTHGMAQRGGMVSAVIEAELPAEATWYRTVLLGLERIEGARALLSLRPGDAAFIATGMMLPPGIQSAPAPSCDEIARAAKALGVELELIEVDADASGLVVQAAIDCGAIP